MSKLSLINRDQKRRKLVKKYEPKRKALEALIADLSKPMEDRYEARLALQALPRNSNPPAQPLPHHRPSARCVQQIRTGSQQAARARNARRNPRLDQGQLVTRG